MAIAAESIVSETGKCTVPDLLEAMYAEPDALPRAMVAKSRPSEAPGSAVPDQLLLAALRHPRLRLRAPMRLKVDREGDLVTVWSDELQELGFGAHLTEAVEDLQNTISELYFTLAGGQDRLGPDMARLWEVLQRYIQEIS